MAGTKRKNPGRPKRPGGVRSVVSVYMPKSLKTSLAKIAKQNKTSMSEEIVQRLKAS